MGLSLNDVALRLKKTEDEILAWEEGEASPTYPQLEKLAFDIYKRPVAVFFLPEGTNMADLLRENFNDFIEQEKQHSDDVIEELKSYFTAVSGDNTPQSNCI